MLENPKPEIERGSRDFQKEVERASKSHPEEPPYAFQICRPLRTSQKTKKKMTLKATFNEAHPLAAEAKITGKSNCASVAPRLSNS